MLYTENDKNKLETFYCCFVLIRDQWLFETLNFHNFFYMQKKYQPYLA